MKARLPVQPVGPKQFRAAAKCAFDAMMTIRKIDIATIEERQGALPSLPVSDTLKRGAPDGTVLQTVPRVDLHAAQTPQGFPFRPILAAHQKAFDLGRTDFTDDASLAEWEGLPVRLVAGSPDNVKLTWARDIEMADQRLSGRGTQFPDVRTGNGYDVHSFGPGDHVTLRASRSSRELNVSPCFSAC